MLQNNGATGDRSEELKNRRPSRPRGAPGGHVALPGFRIGYPGPAQIFRHRAPATHGQSFVTYC